VLLWTLVLFLEHSAPLDRPPVMMSERDAHRVHELKSIDFPVTPPPPPSSHFDERTLKYRELIVPDFSRR
jgi:hypothetical protein